ncbi:uncharacterized protein MELLADRAFT_102371 [Melampsora larici-populina 98AG31]|uniref:Uncharacterized protein n=1 Tax=Melampsora larici-populina (strain 98AG31 / pathotype 3-4-7) TaxID=747676 RepID=F4R828_MELLP|nr:uncharacterized protein MELLADRAFT_102371 [Melampsora larici-populina 98AG31]EGG11423.1 hypothetical protein MELLADRAFT_102371 [Melampsora larici-populina 98AG31]
MVPRIRKLNHNQHVRQQFPFVTFNREHSDIVIPAPSWPFECKEKNDKKGLIVNLETLVRTMPTPNTLTRGLSQRHENQDQSGFESTHSNPDQALDLERTRDAKSHPNESRTI